MPTRPHRPLPRPPDDDLFPPSHFAPYPYPAYAPPTHPTGDHPAPMLPAGTLLHQGFYDLLAMIPTPSPSSLFQWSSNQPPQPTVIAGPRYDPASPVLSPSSPQLRRNRRISKDMVSSPTGFVCVPSQSPSRDDNDPCTATSSMPPMQTRQRPCSLDGAQMVWESSEVCFSILLASALLEPSNSRSAVGQANQIPRETHQQGKSYQRRCQRLKALRDHCPWCPITAAAGRKRTQFAHFVHHNYSRPGKHPSLLYRRRPSTASWKLHFALPRRSHHSSRGR